MARREKPAAVTVVSDDDAALPTVTTKQRRVDKVSDKRDQTVQRVAASSFVHHLSDSDEPEPVEKSACVLVPKSKRLDAKGCKIKTLEVFAGKGNLSAALADLGAFAEKVDILIDKAAHDLSKPSVAKAMLKKLDDPQLRYVHLAPPCATFSCARYPPIRRCK